MYHKGLYTQSLKILDKAKSLAIANEEKNIAYEIIELEKVIEGQYITRSMSNRADKLTVQAQGLSQQNLLASKLSNLSLQLYGEFLKTGFVKRSSETKKSLHILTIACQCIKSLNLVLEKNLWLYKSYLWYSFLIQDFLGCYKYSKKWVDLFHEHPGMIKLNPVFFLNGYQNLLEALFFIKQHDKFKRTLTSLIDITKEDGFPKDDNVQSLAFLYIESNKFNLHFMEGTFKEGLPLIPNTLEGIHKHKTRIDEHHVMVFYYKIASLYFGIGEHQKCIDFLDKIISNKSLQMREDLLCFSRILNLVAHYEAGLDYNLEALIKSTYKFLIKMEDLYLVQKEMIKFLKQLGDIYPQEIKAAFKELHAKLKVLENDPYERRAFLYLDVLSWLESRIENKSVESIIRRKFLFLNKNN